MAHVVTTDIGRIGLLRRIESLLRRFVRRGAGNVSRRTLVLLGVLVGVMAMGISSAGAVRSVPTSEKLSA